MDIIADSRQNPLFDVRQFVPVPYKPGSFYFAVEMYAPLIVLRQDFPEPDPSLGGSDGWCPVYLSKLVLIQQKHGWNDRETVQHARTNLQVKACLNVGADAPAPSQPTLTRHRARMQELGLAEAYSERFLDLIEALELVDMVGTVAVDSVPIDGAGQVLDTFNLLAAAIRKGLSELAARTCRPVKQVAASLSLSDYLSRSIKGTAEIDWSDAGQQRAFLTRLVRDARTVQEALRSCGPGDSTGESSAPAGPQDTIRRSSSTNEPQDSPDSSGQGSLLEPDDDVPAPGAPETSEATAQPADAATIIDKIIDHDIEFDAHQNVVGVLQRPAGDRLISVTDADMRHGRKSASSLISGFKVQIVATVMYGWILLTKVIPANRHDGEDLPWIIRRLSELGVNPRYVLGDHAYGVISNHLHVQSLNDAGSSPIELIARNARPSNGGRFTKDEFTIDMDTRTLTCPAGHACKKPAIAMRGKRKRPGIPCRPAL